MDFSDACNMSIKNKIWSNTLLCNRWKFRLVLTDANENHGDRASPSDRYVAWRAPTRSFWWFGFFEHFRTTSYLPNLQLGAHKNMGGGGESWEQTIMQRDQNITLPDANTNLTQACRKQHFQTTIDFSHLRRKRKYYGDLPASIFHIF